MTPPPERLSPRGARRILYVSDPSSIAMNVFPDPVRPDDLRRWVDAIADSGVDTFNQEVYNQGWSVYWQSARIHYDQRPQHQRFLPLLQAGIQPLEILIDQSHQRSMTFVAGFRMNDTHRFPVYADFYEAHPEWRLTAFPEGEYYGYGWPLDFTFAEVRDYVFEVMQEAASRFDVDGIEMCFRDPGYFPADTGRARAHLMTELVCKARAMLDVQGNGKGRKLLLGARVFSTLEECGHLGLEVPAWISQALIDYVCPMDVMYADFGAPYHEFAALTRNSGCMLYPGLLPWTSSRARERLDQIPLSPASCRAFALTAYGAGADGISVYNHFCGSLWIAPFYPQWLRYLRPLRDPERILLSERHYVFDPTWAGQTGFGPDRCSTGALKANKVVLNRGVPGAADEYRLYLYEDLERACGATLLFRGFGLTEEDELAVEFNGQPVPQERIGRTRAADAPVDWMHVREADGRRIKCIPEQGRIAFGPKPGPAFSTRWFELEADMERWGENMLRVTLVRSDPQATGPVTIDEVEVFVQPK